MASVLKYLIHNEHQNPREVFIEPWAEGISIPPDKTLEIAVSCSTIGTLEIVMHENHTVVWLWKDCRVRVSIDGKDCSPSSFDIPSP
jgi:hypothetical protein